MIKFSYNNYMNKIKMMKFYNVNFVVMIKMMFKIINNLNISNVNVNQFIKIL